MQWCQVSMPSRRGLRAMGRAPFEVGSSPKTEVVAQNRGRLAWHRTGGYGSGQPMDLKVVFKARWVLMLPPVLFALLCRAGEVRPLWVGFVVGGVLFALGLALRLWAQMHLHYRLEVKTVLTRTGPYRFCRNPIYVGNTLILLSMTAMAGLLWFLPVMLVWAAIVYSLVVRYEEGHLTRKYGAPYLEYVAQVPRWFPALRPAAPAVGARGFLLASIRAELHCLLLVVPAIIKALLG